MIFVKQAVHFGAGILVEDSLGHCFLKATIMSHS